jgi:hypothetical protein
VVTAIHDEGDSLVLGECHMTTLNSNPLHFGLVETNTTVTFLECSCGGVPLMLPWSKRSHLQLV